jgi:hypothetical protein
VHVTRREQAGSDATPQSTPTRLAWGGLPEQVSKRGGRSEWRPLLFENLVVHCHALGHLGVFCAPRPFRNSGPSRTQSGIDATMRGLKGLRPRFFRTLADGQDNEVEVLTWVWQAWSSA